MFYLMIAGGLVLLAVTGDLLVRGAAALSFKLRIPPLIVGLTVIAFGTSAPELVVSLDAALTGLPGIAIGNVVGSNIANVLLVLGLPALIVPLSCVERGLRRNTLIMVAASAMLALMILDGVLVWWHGVVMLMMLAGYLYGSVMMARSIRNANAAAAEESGDLDPESLPRSWSRISFLILSGIVGLPIGADLLVAGASALARDYGLSDAVIGLTLVAVGTSFPEIAASVAAAWRRHPDLVLGNAIGSNIFNIFAILGITALVTRLPVPAEIAAVDIWVMLATAALVLIAVLSRRPIGRVAGAAFVTGYAFYVAYLLTRVG